MLNWLRASESEVPHNQSRLYANYYRFLLRTRPKLQLFAVLLALLSIPLTYATLHIPKIIIDDGIKGEGFPIDLYGLPIHQMSFLVALCVAFLFLNIISGFIKLKLNTLVGYISELGLLDLRMTVLKQLHKDVCKDIPSSQKAQIIISEMEAFGGFIGDFISIPVVQISVMGTIVFFMFEQNPLLGVAAIAIIPVQATIVPIMQRRIVRIRKMRIGMVRQFASVIETCDGRKLEPVASDEMRPETFYRIYSKNILKNRMMLFRSKYFLKFTNNMLAKTTPFLFYLIGGILVIEGNLTIGSLTAALVAYQQLDEPWRVLVQFFQRLSTTKMQYDQIVAKVN